MKKIITISACVACVACARAGDNPFFQASLTPDIAVQPKTTEIDGICLSIWGENPQHAFAFGFVNGSTGDSVGFTWGLVNYAESYTGVAWSWVNISTQKFVGWQSGLVNISQGEFVGFQSAAINVADSFEGLQWGFVNYAKDLRGVQIGFANIAMNNPWFKEFPSKLATGFPIVNWSF